MGVVSTWKQTYRRFRFYELVQDLESSAELLAVHRGRTHRINGREERYDPHMLDAANVAKLSWDNMSRMTITRCWMKANCFPTAMSTEIRSKYGPMCSSSKENEVRNVMEMLAIL